MLENYKKLKENFYIMGGHMADDMCQGSLPAILAFMYQEGRLTSYADVAFIIMATTIVNALMQPLTGLWADRKPRPYLMCLGMVVAALGIMFMGFVENFALLLILAAVNGFGVATFHPAAGKLANLFAAGQVGRGMSIFSAGGNFGYALGPLLFTAGYMVMGLEATLLIGIPAFIMAVIFIRKNALYEQVSAQAAQQSQGKNQAELPQEDYKGTFFLLLLVFARSAGMFSLSAFIPLYFIHVLNEPDTLSTLTNSAIVVCGGVATLVGGTFSDRFGFTQLTRWTSFLAVPFGLLFLLCSSASLALLSLMVLSFFYYMAMSPIVVIGQKLLCRHLGLATGLTVGLGISFGGLIAPVLGAVGDHWGLTVAMETIVGIFALAALLSLTIPVVNQRQAAKAKAQAQAQPE